MNTALKPIVVPHKGAKHTATVIVAHGLGDSGEGWSFLPDQLDSSLDYVKFIFPNAPSIPITINGGMRMPGWYDITSLGDIDRTEDGVGIARSREYFHKLIDEEIASGISPNRIVIGGFSQGGAMALHAGLSYKEKLGGIFGLSCYMLLRNQFQSILETSGNANKDTKIFMAHGTADAVVRYDFGKMTADMLKTWGYDVGFNTYANMGHSANPQELADLEKYLTSSLPSSDTS